MSGTGRRFRAEKIDAPGVTKSKSDDLSHDNVCEHYTTVLRLDGKGAWEKGADRWSQTKNSSAVDGSKFFTQLQMLQIEKHRTEGSLVPNIAYKDNPYQFHELAKLAAKVKAGTCSTDERIRLKKSMVSSENVNLHFNECVEIAKERNRIINDFKKKGKKTKKQEKKRPRTETRIRKLTPPKDVDISWMSQSDLIFDERKEYNKDDQDEESLLGKNFKQRLSAISDLVKMHEKYKAKPQVEEVVEIDFDEDDGGEEAIDLDDEDSLPGMDQYPWPDWTDKRELYPKMEVYLVPIPEEGKDCDKEENIVALVLRVLIYDPSIVLGEFFKRLIQNHESRQVNSTKGRYGNNTEMFPAYTSFYNSTHPVATSTTRWTYFRAALDYDKSLKDQVGEDGGIYRTEADFFSQMQPYVRHSTFSADHILRWETAKEILLDCGADTKYLNEEDWIEGCSLTYPEDLYVYQYNQIGFFWYSHENIGLCEQRFPFIDTDQDYLAQIMAGADPRILLDEAGLLREDARDFVAKNSTHMEELRNMIKTDPIIKRRDVQSRKLVKYHTTNEFIYRYAEMLKIYSSVLKHFPSHYRQTWDDIIEFKRNKGYEEEDDDDSWQFLPDFYNNVDLNQRFEECKVYQQMAKRIRDALTKIFKSLWILDGNMEEVPVPEPIKIMQIWLRDMAFPNLTRDYFMYDRDVGMFGNCILRLNEMFVSISKIVHPILCILWIGLFSCYSLKRELKFNMMGHGWRATGKTKTVLDTPKEYMVIPGTTESFTTSTGASDTTDNHRYDWIYLMDETEGYKVDPKEADKNQPLVNKAKVKMVEQQVGHNVFVQTINPDGTTGRSSRVVTTDHFSVNVEVTNKEVSQKDALASRYFRFSMPMPKIPVYELGGKIPENIKGPTQKFMRIGQYLMCCAMKASAVGAILPEPEKEMWSDVSSRVVDHLVHIEAVERDEAMRGLDIMWPLVRQYVYMWAVHCAFDMPGSPNYKKKFEVADIREVEPYLYVTMEIFWFCWTALASQWVDDNRAKLIEAAEKRSGYTLVKESIPAGLPRTSNYHVFENDKDEKVRFLLTPNKDANKLDRQNGNGKLIDLTYVFIEGDLDQISDLLAKDSDLSPVDIKGLINEMSRQMQPPPGGAFDPVPEGSAKYFNRYTNSPGNPPCKNVDAGAHTTMPHIFLHKNANRTIMRTEEDMPRKKEDEAFPVVKKYKDGYAFMVNIAEKYRSDIIIDALVHATVCEEFPEHKFILGTACEDSSTMLQHYKSTERIKQAQIEYLDDEAGWGWNEDTQSLFWKGDENTSYDERPISRRDGISINRRIAISDSKRAFFEMVPTQPTEKGDDSWRSIGKSLDSISDPKITIRNFDEESALRCHLLIGKGFDEPVMTPRYIRKRLEREAEKEGVAWTANKKFPQDIRADELKRQRLFARSINNKTTAVQKAKKWAKIRAMQLEDNDNDLQRDRFSSRDNFQAHPSPPPARVAEKRPRESVIPKAGVHSQHKRARPDVLALRENRVE